MLVIDCFSRRSVTFPVFSSGFSSSELPKLPWTTEWCCPNSLLIDYSCQAFRASALWCDIIGLTRSPTRILDAINCEDRECDIPTMAQMLSIMVTKAKTIRINTLPRLSPRLVARLAARVFLAPNEVHSRCLPRLPLTVTERRSTSCHKVLFVSKIGGLAGVRAPYLRIVPHHKRLQGVDQRVLLRGR